MKRRRPKTNRSRAHCGNPRQFQRGLDLFQRFLQKVGMQIYVGKNGQQLGPFSLEEINRKLADGTFAGTDLGWHEGAAGWAALSTIAGVVVPPLAAPVTPAPVPSPVSPA